MAERTQSDPPAAPRSRHVLAIAAVLAVSMGLYAGSLGLGFFLLDDRDYVVKNTSIQGLTLEHVRRILTEPYFANYSPLHLLSYAIDFAVGGMQPWIYHLSSCVWAALVAVLVYLLAYRLLASIWAALLAALLFAAHPTHVEAVAWIASRKDLVAAFFGVLATIAYLRYRDAPARRVRYALALLCFLLAVAGKMSVVVLPAIWVAFDLWIERRRGLGVLLDKLPFLLVGGAFALAVMAAQPPTRYRPDAYVIGHTFVHNLELLTGLGTQVIYRAQADPGAAAPLKVLLAMAPLVALVLPLAARRRLPGLVLALVWWVLIALVPPQVLSFVHPICDRYLFFPSVGVAILVAIGLQALARSHRRVAVGVAIAIAGIWSARSLDYLSEWRDPRSVWYAATGKSRDPNVFQYLGSHYQEAADRLTTFLAGGALDVAAEEPLAAALWRDDPRLPGLQAEWRARQRGPLTQAYRTRLLDLAFEQFEVAVGLDNAWARGKLYLRRGKLEADRGNLEQAMVELEKAYEESQRYASADDSAECSVRSLYGLAVVAMRRKHHEEALQYLNRAERDQARAGRIWVPEIPQQKAQLQKQIAEQRASGSGGER